MSKIPYAELPEYTLTLPVTKKKVKYRPFIVKEEKVLHMAQNEETVNAAIDAVVQVLKACTFNKVDIASLPSADVDLLFVNVRSKSIGEGVKGEITCPHCENKQAYMINLDKCKVVNLDSENTIKMGNTLLTMKYPTVMTGKDIDNTKEEDLAVVMTARMIESITIDEKVYDSKDFTEAELIDWLEHLTDENAVKVAEFLKKLPSVVYDEKTPCKKCGKDIRIFIEGTSDFFV